MKNKQTKREFSEAILKGRMAESLVEEMLRRAGNKVYRFGYEAILQNLIQSGGKFARNSHVGERIRTIPDFIIIDKEGYPCFVEVKFRWNPDLSKQTPDQVRKIKAIGKDWDARLIYVNCWEQPYFRVSHVPYFNRNDSFCWRPITEVKEWKISTEVNEEFETLVNKYLTPTLVPTLKKNLKQE